jgi:hypothetical protein
MARVIAKRGQEWLKKVLKMAKTTKTLDAKLAEKAIKKYE